MNFQQLRYIRAAVQNDLNLTRVASELFTSQSGVSKQIKELEAELKIEIFVRRGKRLIGLTEAGHLSKRPHKGSCEKLASPVPARPALHERRPARAS